VAGCFRLLSQKRPVISPRPAVFRSAHSSQRVRPSTRPTTIFPFKRGKTAAGLGEVAIPERDLVEKRLTNPAGGYVPFVKDSDKLTKSLICLPFLAGGGVEMRGCSDPVIGPPFAGRACKICSRFNHALVATGSVARFCRNPATLWLSPSWRGASAKHRCGATISGKIAGMPRAHPPS
jgi:hypothetical protein